MTALPLTTARVRAALAAVRVLYGVEPGAILGDSRVQRLTAPRQAALVDIADACDGSCTELARHFGRDHTTILYHLRQGRARAAQDAEFGAAVALIVQEVRRA